MITVRRAVAGDVPWLLGQCRQFAEFFGSSRSLFPDDVTAVEKLTALMNEDVGCFFVAVEPGVRVTVNRLISGGIVTDDVSEKPDDLRRGFIAGILTPHFFNPSIRVLNELLWWVSPEHRGSSAGARLLAAYEKYGEENADWITMTLEAESPVNPAALTKRGFRLYESSYLKEIECLNTTAEPAGSKLDMLPGTIEWCAGPSPV